MNSQEIGRLAEEATACLYADKGYRVISRNFRYRKFGEIDLIVQRVLQNGVTEVVFCEVKCRRDTTFASPSLAVNNQKRRRIRTLAQIFLSQNAEFYHAQLRFDVAEVNYRNENFNVNILENAF